LREFFEEKKENLNSDPEAGKGTNRKEEIYFSFSLKE